MIFTFDVDKRISASTNAIANTAGGLPFDSVGNLVIADDTAAPARLLNGWPLDASGAVAIDYGGTTVRNQNGSPFTSSGRLAVDETNPVEGFSNGIPYTSSGISISIPA